MALAILVTAAVIGTVAGLITSRLPAPPRRIAAPITSGPATPSGTGPRKANPPATRAAGALGIPAATTTASATAVGTLPDPVQPTGPVACGARGHCLALGLVGTTLVLLATTDGGSSWRAERLPPGASPLSVSLLTCASASVCYLGGSAAGRPVLDETHDEGASWHRAVLPPGLDSLTAMACPSPSRCVVAGEGGLFSAGEVEVAVTTDGGRHFAAGSRSPGLATATTLTCPTADICLMGGTTGRPGRAGAVGALVRSTDFAGSWRRVDEPLPGPTGVSEMEPAGLTCAGRSVCYAVAAPASKGAHRLAPYGSLYRSADAGARWSTVSTRLPVAVAKDTTVPPALACSSPEDCVLAWGGWKLLVTTDAGRSFAWAQADRLLPVRDVDVRAISCSPPSAGASCVVSWSTASPARTGLATGPARALMAAGGTHPALLRIGRLPGGGPSASVSCASVRSCLVGARGSSFLATFDPAPGGRGLRRVALPGSGRLPVVASLGCSGGLCWSDERPAGGGGSGRPGRPALEGWPASGGAVTLPEPAGSGAASGEFCTTRRLCALAVGTGGRPGLALTVNGGRHWRRVEGPPWLAGSRTDELAACWSPRDCLMAVARGGSTSLVRTRDGGRSWHLVRPVLPGRDRLESLGCDERGDCSLEASGATGTSLGVLPGVARRVRVLTVPGPGGVLRAAPRCVQLRCWAPAVVGGAAGLLRTSDGGLGWSFLSLTGSGGTALSTGSSVSCPSEHQCVAVVAGRSSQLLERVRIA